MMKTILNYLHSRRTRMERELDRELKYHIDRRTEELVADGLNESEALRLAHQEIGRISDVREAVRETWFWPTLDALALDFRYGIRSLTKSKGFAVGAGAVLALAIAANTAIFSVVRTVLLEPLPYPDADRIVSIETFFTNSGQSSQMVSNPDFLDWQARQDVFEQMALFINAQDLATTVDGTAMFGNLKLVTGDFFAVFGQTAVAGRLLTEQDVPATGVTPTSAVVAYPWAVTHFGSAEAAIGETFSLEGSRKEIVGVAAPEFRYPADADFWLAFDAEPAPEVTVEAFETQRNNFAFQAVGKLKPSVPFSLAQAQLRTIGDNLAQQNVRNRVKTVNLVPLKERLTGDLRITLWALMCAVGVLWFIACANLANLQLARAAVRMREMAVRAALGAGRSRVVQRLLTESLVLAALGGLVGLVLAVFLVQGIVAFSPDDLRRIDEVRIDMSAFAFALGLTLVSTVLFGLVPALHASRLNPSDALKEGGTKATATSASTRLRSGLVVAEVALSVILLATAGLLVRSYQGLERVDLGFTTERVVAAYVEYVAEDGSRAEIQDRLGFFAEVLDRLRETPGVEAAATVAYLGMGWEPRALRDTFIEGRPELLPGERPQAEFHPVSEDYFKTLEIPIVAGRDFTRADGNVAIINETLARIAFPGESPLGQGIKNGNPEAWDSWAEIIGIVSDTRWQDPSRPAPPMMFVQAMNGIGNTPAIVARTSLDATSLMSTLRMIINDVNPRVPIKIATMEEMFDSTLAYPRFRTQVIGLFAGLATVLAAVGIFSVLVYLVGLRTRELALRQVLGAKAMDVVRLIAIQGLRLVAIGLVLGLAATLAAAQLLRSLLFEIGPWDIGTYLGTIVLLGGVALAATLAPAIRAGMIAPVAVLQQE